MPRKESEHYLCGEVFVYEVRASAVIRNESDALVLNDAAFKKYIYVEDAATSRLEVARFV